jgi:WD40 repeat protein/serine/threonine protein kinase
MRENAPNDLTIFNAALEINGPAERAAYIDEACGADTALREKILSLLVAYENGADSLDRFGGSGAGDLRADARDSEHLGSVIGRYKLLEKLGEGGCGVVYVAEQDQPVRRRVALKVIKLGMDTRSVIARFEAERQALAMMDHPNIAKVLDASATDTGRPFFVMELVRGTKITEYCDRNQLATSERLDLFLQVCRAVQHAHQKGIIHRDLKPSNILVTVNDGVAVPKVIDFGIAKATEGRLTDKTVYTELHQFIGTPAYMSPEQAELTSVDIDTRSDIYSLGVLLYELLTGKTPFEQQELLKVGLDEMRRTIQTKEPPRPSTRLSTLPADDLSTTAKARRSEPPKLIHLVRGDLDWIVMKCLEKDRARRYGTASGLAMDIQRHLTSEPVVARPPSNLYRFQKLVQRNKLAFAAAGAVTLALVGGIGVSTWLFIRESKAHDRAVAAERAQSRLREAAQAAQANETQQRQRAEAQAYAGRMRLAQTEWDQNHVGLVRQILEQTTTYPKRGFEWYYWQQQTHQELKTLRGHLDEVYTGAFSPDGQRIVTGGKDRTAKVWDAATGKEILTLRGHEHSINSASFSQDGRRILTSSKDETAKVWDAVSGQVLLTLTNRHGGRAWSAAFSPDGGRIVTSSDDRKARVWDAASGQVLLTLTGHLGRVFCAAFSPDGRRIVTGSEDQTAKVWDAASGREQLTLKGHKDWVWCAAFSPDAQRIITGSKDQTANVWDAATGQISLTLPGHNDAIWAVAFSPNGQRIATGSGNQTARIWEAASGKELFTLKGHDKGLNSVAFSPDGQRFVTGSDDHTVKVWDATRAPGPPDFQGQSDGLMAVAISPDGRQLVTGSKDNTANVWEAATGKVLHTLEGHSRPVRAVAFSPDGRRIVTGSGDQTARVWDAASGITLFTNTGHIGPISGVTFSPDDRWIATASADKTARIWDAATGKHLYTFSGHNGGVWAVAFSPDSQRIVTGSWDRTAKVWEVATRNCLMTLTGHVAPVVSVAFSRDGERIVTASSDRTARVWEAATGHELFSLAGHSDEVRCVAFSPDSRRVVTGALDNTAKVWDAANGEELLTLKGHNDMIGGVAFSPDGQRIVTASYDNTVKLWQAATLAQVAAWQTEEREASERLAALAREQAAAAEQQRSLQAQDSGAIKQWLVLVPITGKARNGTTALIEEQLPQEALQRPRVGDRVDAGDSERGWRPVSLWGYELDFEPLLNGLPNWCLAYALSYIESKADQTNLCLKVGSDDLCLVYLNGKEVYRREEPRAYVPDQDVVTGLALKTGLNVLLFKLALEDADQWRGSIRFTDAAGQPLKGIRGTITPALDQDPGSITEWLVLAPIAFEGTNGANALAQQQIPDEANLRPWAGARSRVGGREGIWREFHLDEYGLDFNELSQSNGEWSVAYAVCYLVSETDQTGLTMKIGSDDQSKVYLNGKEIYRCEQVRGFVPDEDEVTGVSLRAGSNTLVFKVVNERFGWGGSIRFTDAAGHPVKGIRVTLTPSPSR